MTEAIELNRRRTPWPPRISREAAVSAGTCTSAVLFAWVVRWVDIYEGTRSDAMRLDDRHALRPDLMLRHAGDEKERSCRHLYGCLSLRGWPNPQEDRSLNHCDVLINRVGVKRNGVPVGELEPQSVGAGLGGVSLHDNDLRARRA